LDKTSLEPNKFILRISTVYAILMAKIDFSANTKAAPLILSAVSPDVSIGGPEM